MNPRQRKVAARRLTHRSRSVAVSVALSLFALAAVYVATESVLAALRLRPLLLSPATVIDAVRGDDLIAFVAAAGCLVLGVVLIALAVAPGRQGRHVLADERSVIVVDDTILAGTLSRAAAAAAHVPPAQVSTALGRRSARVSVSPISGFPVSEDAVSTAVDEVIVAAGPVRTLSRRVVVEPRGKVA